MEKAAFKPVGKAFCDGFSIYKCPMLFKVAPAIQLTDFLRQKKISVKSITNSPKANFVFVKLEAGGDMYSDEFTVFLKEAVDALREQTLNELL